MEYHDRHSFAVTETAAEPKVVCYNRIEATQHTSEGLEDVQALHKLLTKCKEPLIPELSRRNEMKYLSVCFTLPWL